MVPERKAAIAVGPGAPCKRPGSATTSHVTDSASSCRIRSSRVRQQFAWFQFSGNPCTNSDPSVLSHAVGSAVQSRRREQAYPQPLPRTRVPKVLSHELHLHGLQKHSLVRWSHMSSPKKVAGSCLSGRNRRRRADHFSPPIQEESVGGHREDESVPWALVIRRSTST